MLRKFSHFSPPPPLDIPPPSPSSPASRRLTAPLLPVYRPLYPPPPPRNQMRGLFMQAKFHKVKLKIIDNRVLFSVALLILSQSL